MAESKSDDRFDQYEFVALIVPGSVVLCGAAVMLGRYPLISKLNAISVGGFGLFVILAYVAGHIVDFGGGLLQGMWWRTRGMPTDQIIEGRARSFGAAAFNAINFRLEHFRIAAVRLPQPDMTAFAKQDVTRRIYIELEKSGKSRRVDAFNRTYGLMRGLAAAFMVLAAIARVSVSAGFDLGSGVEISNRSATLFFVICAAAAFQRMIHFGWKYANELFYGFAQIDLESPAGSSGPTNR